MKIISHFGFCFLVLLRTGCSENIEKIMSKVVESVVKIEVVTINGAILTGSGFIVDSNGLIVTNDHVLGETSNVTIKCYDNRIFQGNDVGIIYRNELQDIAILAVRESGFPYLSFGEPVKYLQNVYVIGYPMGELKTETGKTTSIEETVLGEFSYIPVNATLDPGYSGAPVVNEKGKVVGIATKIRGRNLNYAIPIRYVRSILDKLNLTGNKPEFIDHSSYNGLLYSEQNINWNVISGNWIRDKDVLINIAHVEEPYGEGVVGLVVSDRYCNNFFLETRMRSIARFDGYKNIDTEVVFRYLNKNNFYAFNTYSGKKENEFLPLWKQDKGGLWKVNNGHWEILQTSKLVQEFKNDRWYNVKIFADGPRIKVYIDNVKCIDVYDNSFGTGKLGFRATSSHAWFGPLNVYSLY